MGGSAGQGWEKCYVLGKESAYDRARHASWARGVRFGGDHPRATTTGHASHGDAQPVRTGPAVGRDPPVQAGTRGLDLLGGDPENP
ncbi:hypothetical protein Sgou_14520 [Streptomyces gougerotii]|uniref:Uncharacterized protein n=2 Tax=Streptomyces diastaticus group TaxID=2849069 RepID=A0A8H9HGX6_9ACTN|nr:hypothetical protein Srut_42380 [Streptomyces rutgersensis]GFH74480.1 hypothetical protein Sdia_52480 [Streptomyces diastaticus subsp. diastaticus]GFH76782.1 hypothetical protein Sgou_14520 [Streptomyces gougerotii]GGU03292.1 hypothetical protein GCM10015534_01170 [Streptomyces diastaticus subsp. diastaticus]GGU64773.1 hypothetical protein GCM10010227_17840 [Streptomyces gougerotii]